VPKLAVATVTIEGIDSGHEEEEDNACVPSSGDRDPSHYHMIDAFLAIRNCSLANRSVAKIH